jgi:hypothetical protein
VSQPVSCPSVSADTQGSPRGHNLPTAFIGPLGPDTRDAFLEHAGKLFGKDSSKWELQGKPSVEYSENNLKRCGSSKILAALYVSAPRNPVW